MKKIKILFILPHLKPGGAEKVVSYLFKNLDINFFQPKMLVISSEKEKHFEIENSNILFLNKKRLRHAFYSIFRIIYKEKFDLVFSSIYHINLYLGLVKHLFLKTKFVIREANVYSVRNKFSYGKRLPKAVQKHLYNNIDFIIFQSVDMKEDFIEEFELKKNNYTIINNPITINYTPKTNSNLLLNNQFLNIGSLEEKKGQKRILQLFEKVEKKYHLHIFGQGSLKNELEKIILKMKLVDRVFLKGVVKNIDSILPNYSYYIQGSYVEGFPNSLLEALSFGIPCLVFKSPGGHNDMIIEGFNGFFIEEGVDEQNILDKFLNYNWDRESIQKDCFERFNSKKIITQYEDLFLKIMK